MPNLRTHRAWPLSTSWRKNRLRYRQQTAGMQNNDGSNAGLILPAPHVTWRERARVSEATAGSIAICQGHVRKVRRRTAALAAAIPAFRTALLTQTQLDTEIDAVTRQKANLDAAFENEGVVTRRGRLTARSMIWVLIALIGFIEVLAMKSPLLVAYDIQTDGPLGVLEEWTVPLLSMGVVLAGAAFAERRKHLADTLHLDDDNPERKLAVHGGRQSWWWLAAAEGLRRALAARRRRRRDRDPRGLPVPHRGGHHGVPHLRSSKG